MVIFLKFFFCLDKDPKHHNSEFAMLKKLAAYSTIPALVYINFHFSNIEIKRYYPIDILVLFTRNLPVLIFFN